MQKKISFQKELIEWYNINHRILPWRSSNDPYKVWISEIMLQQTKVDAVIPYYNNFIEKFPDIFVLANSEEEEVLKFWEGLGYYSRAKNLHKCAGIIKNQYHGVFPSSHKELLSLPGIGPYTAGAILSIAFNKNYPAIDGNVIRVFSRLYSIEDNVCDKSTLNKIQNLVSFSIPPKQASTFNQALMELGALICIPKSPRCNICPIKSHCTANTNGLQKNLPIKNKKKKQKEVNIAFFIIFDEEKFLIEKNSDTTLLSGLWRLPTMEILDQTSFSPTAKDYIQSHYGVTIKIQKEFCTSKHIFTHLIWNIKVYICSIEKDTPKNPFKKYEWITPEQIDNLPFATAYKKILHELYKAT